MVPQDPPSNVRLDSWKEIAAYLKRDATTVRRWEKREGLPVHRDPHDRRDSAYAYAAEIDAWLEGRRNGSSADTAPAADAAPAASGMSRRAVIAAAAAAALVTSGVLAIGVDYYRNATADARPVRLPFSVPHPLIMADAGTGGQFSISPDGGRISFVAAAADGIERLWIRPLDSLAAEPLAETEGATYPFWSPDGEFVAFFAQRKLRRSPRQADPCRSWATRCCREAARGIARG